MRIFRQSSWSTSFSPWALMEQVSGEEWMRICPVPLRLLAIWAMRETAIGIVLPLRSV